MVHYRLLGSNSTHTFLIEASYGAFTYDVKTVLDENLGGTQR
jgi:hypothetical protein